MLGALASVLSTWLVTGILLYEAVNRVINPTPVNGKSMPLLSLITMCVSLCQLCPDLMLIMHIASNTFNIRQPQSVTGAL